MGSSGSKPTQGLVENKTNPFPAKVSKIFIDGIERTKEDILRDRVKHVFKSQSFDDVVNNAQDARIRLQTLGCFSDVVVQIDTSKEGGPQDYEITFKVKELGRIKGIVNTLFGNQQGSLQCGLVFPNIWGRGERFSADYTRGFRECITFNGTLTKPLIHNSAIGASVFQQMATYPNSGYKETNRGMAVDLTFMTGPQMVHNLSYEGVWRDLRCAGKESAFAIREHSGHTLKSSIKHIFTVDKRDDHIFPNEGSYFRANQEFAGLGGNIGFFKNSEKNITVADKFFIGGPLNVRGFEQRGLGHHIDGNAIGCSSFWASGLHLFHPIPLGRGGFGDFFRIHGFLNAGNALHELSADALFRDTRMSYGCGLAFKLGGMARIELNYCIPVSTYKGDRLSPGFQFGVGVNFL
ncbi:SAM50 [Lepeophtheirus salmonis]|uniref:SAM50 n=1 Tax=Lepeophtheirus salmonis TaxID=72036 RepID=A0A7R8CNU2_LEPSM|nr:SAM50 [Lepeophtheirus salmonis]CAF2875021.1 SAM50 [Lepeophtheirus salmonis]